MNFKQFFQEKLMPLINAKLNLSIAEEAQPEEIEQAIQEAQSLEDATQAARQDMKDEIAKQVAEQMAQSQQQEPAEAGQETEPMQAITATLEKLNAKIDSLTQYNKELEGKVADKTDKQQQQAARAIPQRLTLSSSRR